MAVGRFSAPSIVALRRCCCRASSPPLGWPLWWPAACCGAAAAASPARRASRLNQRQPISSTRRRELDRLGTWDSREYTLPEIDARHSIKRGTPIPLITPAQVGICSHRGRRPYQEDRFTLFSDSAAPHDLLVVGVWDGHGGDACAEFCAQHVQEVFRAALADHARKSLPTTGGGGREEAVPADLDLGALLTTVLHDLNEKFAHCFASKVAGGNDDGSGFSSGTTATVAVIREGYELVVAHVGDSKALLCRDGEPRCLTKDHCPSDPAERARITAAGGSVSADAIGRHLVNRRLAMSRSLGDVELKPFGVSAEPDVAKLRIKHGKDQFLVLLSDGIGFVMSDKEIVDCVRSAAAATIEQAAEKLVDQALHYACEDNATALIVPLGSWGKGDPDTSMFYSLGRSIGSSARFA